MPKARARRNNYTEAARWFGRAAALGLADSQFNLAVLYERGHGRAAEPAPKPISGRDRGHRRATIDSKARVTALTTQLSQSDHDEPQKAADTFKPQPLNRSRQRAAGNTGTQLILFNDVTAVPSSS